MQKNYTLLIVLFSLIFIPKANASHFLGGEITWRCNGAPGQSQYVFFMTVYQDCSGVSWNYVDETLKVFGTPLPRNSVTNAEINSITLKTDSVKWVQLDSGDINPACDPTGVEQRYSCSSGDPGTIQAFYYKSDPIDMKGTPPASGWRFGWQALCCRPNVRNLSGGAGTMTLRALMYPDKDNSSVEGCIDNSPEFGALPVSSVCKGYLFTYNHTAVDYDLDSLVYGWDRPYDSPLNNPTPRTYAAGFNYNNPTPGPSFNNQNVAATLDSITGIERMAVYSGGASDAYLTVVRVDAYREGTKIASVFREIPIVFYDCPDLEQGPGGIGGGANSPPQTFIDGRQAEGHIVSLVAGQDLRVPFQAMDYDYGGSNSSTALQRISVVPDGLMFSTDFLDTNLCITPQAQPCAILRNQTPTLNSNLRPPRKDINALGVVSTELYWPVKCHHVKITETGTPGNNESIYNFVLRTSDDHCPIPGINYPTITVKVRDPFPLTAPIVKGASVDLDGRIVMQWAPPIDSASAFTRYNADVSATNNGNSPTIYTTSTPINDYSHQHAFTAGYGAVFINGPNNRPEILNKRSGKDWYLRMTSVSGCNKDVATDPSDPVKIIEVESTPSGVLPDPLRSKVTLNWNRPKPQSANTYPYYIYESPTHFYIWENDSIEQGGQYIGGEDNPNNWYLRGSTDTTTFDAYTNTCNGRVGFRVEARDTVITYAQGSSISTGQPLDTLTFRTFSVIDTVLMSNRGYIPNPEFDTIMVSDTGSVYFRIDRANAGTAHRFKIFDHNNQQRLQNEIADLRANNATFLYTGANANNAVDSFFVQSFDRCDLNNSALSNVYTTMKLSGQLLTPLCSALYELQWNKPTGFSGGIRRYDVYVDSANTGFKRVDRITDENTTVSNVQLVANVDYKFRVIAKSNSNAVNVSTVLNLSSPPNLRTFEVVSAPELICANIESNGAVTLSFVDPRDTSNNGVEYEFDYRIINGNWQTFAGSDQVNYGVDNQVLITGINAHQNDYEFRARTISGCDGITPSAYSKTISSEGVEVLNQFVDYLYVDGKDAVSYQWFDCNLNFSFPGETNKQFVPSDTGTYGVYVEYADCSDTSICYTVNHLDTSVTQLSYNALESDEESSYYQWVDCREDTLIPRANSRSFVAADTGYYAVILRAYGYRDTSACIPMFSVGLDELNFSEQINFFPNPTKGSLTIETGAIQESLLIKVCNIHGQLVQEEQFVNQSNLQLQLNGKPGIYFIELINSDGERANVKVIKR